MAAISAIRLCKDEHFIPPASFDRSDYFAGRFGAVAGDAAHTVRLLVDAKRAPYFRRKIYHPSQQIETERDDGQLVVTYTVQGLEEIGAWVRSWGSKVKVLAPDTLAMQVVEEAEAMQAQYRD
jgi:predicted DNA-binding transcriptional regulator YafY